MEVRQAAAGKGDPVAEALAQAYRDADRAAAHRAKLRRRKRLLLWRSRLLPRRLAQVIFNLLGLKEL